MSDPVAPVVIIGAGLAGLTASHVLTEEGVPNLVIEARDRVGGRAHTVRAGFESGQHGDVGGELIGGSYRVVRALCDDLGVTLVGGARRPGREGDVAATAFEEMLTSHQLIVGGELVSTERLDALLGQLRIALNDVRPGLDETVAQWGRRARLSPETYTALVATTRARTQLDPHQADAPWLEEVPAGAFQRVAGGISRLADTLSRNSDVRLNTPVRAVRQRRGQVEVVLDRGETLVASQVILAVSPFVLGTMAFDPPLPAAKLAALSSLQRAQGGKVVAQYREGDAVRAAFSCAVITDGPFNTAILGNPDADGGPAVVSGSVCGGARGLLESEDAALATLDELVRIVVGCPVTRLHGVVKNWSEDTYALGVAGRPPLPERDGSVALLGAPDRRVRFAGDYTDAVFCGTFEGAARSGVSAAREVLRHPARVDLEKTLAKLVRA